MSDPFQLLIAFVLGVLCYAIAIRFIPGMQPGEAKINALLEKIGIHIAAVTANTTATQAAVATVAAVASNAATTATPSNVAIAAAAEALRLQNLANAAAQNGAGSTQTAPPVSEAPNATSSAPAPDSADETPVQWASRTGAVAGDELLGFDAFAHTAPASMTFADVLTAYKATNATHSLGMPMTDMTIDPTSDPRLNNPASPFYKLQPLPEPTRSQFLAALSILDQPTMDALAGDRAKAQLYNQAYAGSGPFYQFDGTGRHRIGTAQLHSAYTPDRIIDGIGGVSAAQFAALSADQKVKISASQGCPVA